MSGFDGGIAGNRKVKLTTTSVTDIVAETQACLVKTVYATEIASSTATFSLEIYDGTSSFYLMKAKPMTALQTLMWGDIPLGPGEKLRATAGTADKIDVIAVIAEPAAG